MQRILGQSTDNNRIHPKERKGEHRALVKTNRCHILKIANDRKSFRHKIGTEIQMYVLLSFQHICFTKDVDQYKSLEKPYRVVVERGHSLRSLPRRIPA
jgi:hypothetical protein